MNADWKQVLWDIRGEGEAVTCARCGKPVPFEEAEPEEGGEWECFPCNERCNEQERIENASREDPDLVCGCEICKAGGQCVAAMSHELR